MRWWRVPSVLVVIAAVLVTVPSLTLAEPAVPAYHIPFAVNSAEYLRIGAELDAATARALDLERTITETNAALAALEERIAVTEQRIRIQREAVREAEVALAEAQVRYDRHMVVVYKRGSVEAISLLLSSDTLSELVSNAEVLSRMAAEDAAIVAERNVAAAEAQYQAATLDDLHAQDSALQSEERARLTSLERALDEQQRAIAHLDAEAREVLRQARRLDADARTQWRSNSLPLGVPIPRIQVAVFPSSGPTYLASAYMPAAYRSTGERFSAVCSWYGNEFHGRPSASGQIFNEDDFTCASKSLPFGTVLALTNGDARIIVYVNDRGPFVAGRDLDLSKAAARALGISGVERVDVEVVVPFDGIE